MLNILFFILLMPVLARLFILAVRATWGIGKILVGLVFMPLGLAAMVLLGLVRFALPLLIAAGLISLLCGPGVRRF